jgi:hypothetical protein
VPKAKDERTKITDELEEFLLSLKSHTQGKMNKVSSENNKK